ncbi:probable insulin-like peptide 2 [Drosophila bipectinata]|uniref:probable insulin-like peptide 2 n=1 Tax=Drosophila bipectinata TaxID=42026 RepID=UPI0007E790F7|nr:probable insulin-like peptide 2 [Drosophila bipectinata]
MCKVLSLAVLLILAFVASVHSWSPTDNVMRCSFQLSEALSLICKEFNPIIPRGQKRGMPITEMDPLDPIQYVEEKESDSSALDVPQYSFASLYSGRFNGDGPVNSLSALHRRTRQGIVDRCCRTKCSYSTLLEYCSVPL